MANDERLVFTNLVEALFTPEDVRRLTPEHKARLRAAELDLDRPLLPAYPAARVKPWIDVAVEALYPGRPTADAERQLGQKFLRSWSNTLLGSAVMQVLKVIGPKRTLFRVERAFRHGDNFTHTEAEELAPTKVRVRINDVMGVPEYYAGIIEYGGHVTGAKNVRVTVEGATAPGAVLLVEWD